MSETIIIALISLLGTLGGTFGGILATSKLTNYRIEQLEKKGDKVTHNGLRWISEADSNVWEPGVYGWTNIN